MCVCERDKETDRQTDKVPEREGTLPFDFTPVCLGRGSRLHPRLHPVYLFNLIYIYIYIYIFFFFFF